MACLGAAAGGWLDESAGSGASNQLVPSPRDSKAAGSSAQQGGAVDTRWLATMKNDFCHPEWGVKLVTC